MFTATNLILGCAMVASGFGWMMLPVMVAAGMLGDWFSADSDEDE